MQKIKEIYFVEPPEFSDGSKSTHPSEIYDEESVKRKYLSRSFLRRFWKFHFNAGLRSVGNNGDSGNGFLLNQKKTSRRHFSAEFLISVDDERVHLVMFLIGKRIERSVLGVERGDVGSHATDPNYADYAAISEDHIDVETISNDGDDGLRATSVLATTLNPTTDAIHSPPTLSSSTSTNLSPKKQPNASLLPPHNDPAKGFSPKKFRASPPLHASASPNHSQSPHSKLHPTSTVENGCARVFDDKIDVTAPLIPPHVLVRLSRLPDQYVLHERLTLTYPPPPPFFQSIKKPKFIREEDEDPRLAVEPHSNPSMPTIKIRREFVIYGHPRGPLLLSEFIKHLEWLFRIEAHSPNPPLLLHFDDSAPPLLTGLPPKTAVFSPPNSPSCSCVLCPYEPCRLTNFREGEWVWVDVVCLKDEEALNTLQRLDIKFWGAEVISVSNKPRLTILMRLIHFPPLFNLKNCLVTIQDASLVFPFLSMSPGDFLERCGSTRHDTTTATHLLRDEGDVVALVIRKWFRKCCIDMSLRSGEVYVDIFRHTLDSVNPSSSSSCLSFHCVDRIVLGAEVIFVGDYVRLEPGAWHTEVAKLVSICVQSYANGSILVSVVLDSEEESSDVVGAGCSMDLTNEKNKSISQPRPLHENESEGLVLDDQMNEKFGDFDATRSHNSNPPPNHSIPPQTCCEFLLDRISGRFYARGTVLPLNSMPVISYRLIKFPPSLETIARIKVKDSLQSLQFTMEEYATTVVDNLPVLTEPSATTTSDPFTPPSSSHLSEPFSPRSNNCLHVASTSNHESTEPHPHSQDFIFENTLDVDDSSSLSTLSSHHSAGFD